MEPNAVWIVIPAFNEGQSIGKVIDLLRPDGWSIVVVDDGSSDGTFEEAARRGVHRCRHVVNLGQGAALQTGIRYALQKGARYVVTFDADGQHRAEDVRRLLRPVVEDGVDVALGTRFGSDESTGKIPAARRFLLRLAVAYTRWTVGIRVTDTHNGLRAFRAEAAAKINLVQNRMSHATEVLQQIRRHRLSFVEVPVCIDYTTYSLGKGQSGLNAFTVLCDSVRELLRI